MKQSLMKLQQTAKSYSDLTDAQKASFLKSAYQKHELSWPDIAKMCGTYPNKVRRDATKFGIESRSQTDAQSLALKTGARKHPTEGTKRPEETKIRVSESVAKNWEEMSKQDRKARSDTAKKLWDKKTQAEIDDFNKKAGDAVREAAKTGSKLEKFLAAELQGQGYVVQLHKEHVVKNQNVHLDLYLPKLNVVIEVDGPSHHKPIWGALALQRTRRTDAEKDGLLLGMGFVVIRIKQLKTVSAKYKRDILKDLSETLSNIKEKFPVRSKRRIILGD